MIRAHLERERRIKTSDREYEGEEGIKTTYDTSSEQACSEFAAVFGDL